MLSNILLEYLEKELERRKLMFVRYADNFVTFVCSERSAQGVFPSVQRYLTHVLKLDANEQQSGVRLSQDYEYLGYVFTGKRVTITIAPKKLQAFNRRVKELGGRSSGVSMLRRLTDLNRYVRGWTGYCGWCQQFDLFDKLYGWIRRQIRMCFWIWDFWLTLSVLSISRVFVL